MSPQQLITINACSASIFATGEKTMLLPINSAFSLHFTCTPLVGPGFSCQRIVKEKGPIAVSSHWSHSRYELVTFIPIDCMSSHNVTERRPWSSRVHSLHTPVSPPRTRSKTNSYNTPATLTSGILNTLPNHHQNRYREWRAMTQAVPCVHQGIVHWYERVTS